MSEIGTVFKHRSRYFKSKARDILDLHTCRGCSFLKMVGRGYTRGCMKPDSLEEECCGAFRIDGTSIIFKRTDKDGNEINIGDR